jgi:hypothetical protein
MPSAQDFAERLRKQAYKTLSPQIGALEQELQNVASSLSAGVQQIERRLEALRHIELPTAEPVLDEFLGEAIRQKDLVTGDLAHFARGIRRRETQEEILTLLLDSAQKCSPRIALYVVRGDRFIGWSSRGYSESLAKKISSCSFSRADCRQFQETLEDGNPAAVPELPEVDSLHLLKEEAQGPWRLLPLRAMQRPIALLLAGHVEGIPVRSDSLSVLADFAMLQLENVALRILYELTAAKPEAVPQAAPSQEVTVPESVAAVETSPEIAPEPQLIAQGEAEEPPGEERLETRQPEIEEAVQVEEREERPDILQSASSKEAVPAAGGEEPLEARQPEIEEAVQVEEREERPDILQSAPFEEAVPAAEGEEPLEAQQPEIEEAPLQETQPQPFPEIPEEEKLHSDAKKFARLLVSEIKLYNENRVVEGREHRDIYIRLKRDIDRSREMYEKRVSPIVSRKIDYFHDEIIRILGDNDSSTLGSDYPGPRVES